MPARHPTAEEVLRSPCTSYWLRMSLSGALMRDPVDAAADAKLLSDLLSANAEEALIIGQSDLPGRAQPSMHDPLNP